MQTLASLRPLLPEGFFSYRDGDMRVEVLGLVSPGQPVRVKDRGRAVSTCHVAHRMYSTVNGTTVADLTFVCEPEQLLEADHLCSICDKPAIIEYTSSGLEWACVMCHYWLTCLGLSNLSADGKVYILRELPGGKIPKGAVNPNKVNDPFLVYKSGNQIKPNRRRKLFFFFR